VKKLILLLALLAITSCQSMHSNDPNSIMFSIPKGSTLSLDKKLNVPNNDTHAVIQYGKEISDKERHDYDVNCRLDVKAFGPRTIEPEKFTVTRTEDGQNWISQPSILRFYTEIYLTSDKGTDIIKMVCQEYGDQTDYHFTVEDIEVALGDYFSFAFASDK
jgi:hypothetical protein